MAGAVTPRKAAGDLAEERAASFLASRGMRIVERNFRTRFGEIDLIASDGPTLVFVEVRMRSADRFGGSLESIDSRKRSRLVAAANGYLRRIGREPPCRFDVVTLDAGEPIWIRAAFDAA